MNIQSESQCKKCGSQNNVGARHCAKCGSDLNSICPVCGSSYRNAVFCGNCGQALSDGVTLGDVIGADEESIPDRGDLKLPIPGQIMKLVQQSITVYRENFLSFLILSFISGIPLLILTVYFDTKISRYIQSNSSDSSPEINMAGISNIENLVIVMCLLILIAISGI